MKKALSAKKIAATGLLGCNGNRIPPAFRAIGGRTAGEGRHLSANGRNGTDCRHQERPAKTRRAGALLGTLALGTASRATPIAYQFSIDLGGTTSGTFVFDAATNQESDVSITVAGDFNPTLDGVYTQVGPSTPPATTPFFGTPAADIIFGTTPSGAEAWVGFSAPLTPTGGLITVTGVFVDLGNFEQTSGISPPGSATPVVAAPEPASLAVLAVGLVGLVAGRRSRPARVAPHD